MASILQRYSNQKLEFFLLRVVSNNAQSPPYCVIFYFVLRVTAGGGGGKKGRGGLWLCLESCAEPGARTTELHHPLLDLVHLGLGQSWQAILKHFQHTNKEYKSTTNKWRIFRKERNFFPSKILAKIICYQCFGLCGSGIPKMSLWIRIQVKSRL